MKKRRVRRRKRTQTSTLRIWTQTGADRQQLLALARQAFRATRDNWLWRQIGSLFGHRAHYAKAPVIGFAYSLDHCRFFILGAQGTPYYGQEAAPPDDWNQTYEIRLFTQHFELRWQQDGTRTHLALLADGKAARRLAKKIKGLEEDTNRPVRLASNHYLLWGEPVEQTARPDKGWTRLTSARIGPLLVPFARKRLKKKQRVILETREYFTQETDGNWVFAGERLIGLSSA